jgi:hypothetical protein
MQIDKMDFLIVKGEKKKKLLVRVTNNSDPLKAIVCDKYQKDKDRATYIEVGVEDIYSNLGKQPKFGQCYGIPTEYVRLQREDLDHWSRILIYRKLNEDEIKTIFKGLEKVAAQLHKDKLFPHEKLIEVSVKDSKGLLNGHYSHFPNKKDRPDELVLSPVEFIKLRPLIYHEMGHGVWNQLMDDKLRARWVRAFYKNVSLVKDTEIKIKKMRNELIEAETIRAYNRELDDDDKELFEAVLKTIKRTFDLRPKHINCLINDGDDLKEIWPQELITVPHKKILVTEYALKAPEELFSDTFMLHYDEKHLPKSIQKLINKTFSIIRSNSNNTKD